MMTKRTIDVLLVEDSPSDAMLLEELLARSEHANFNLYKVETLADCLARLDITGTDIVVLDLQLPDSSGIETYLGVKSKTQKVPVIVLTGLDELNLAMTSLGSGAEDYMVKGQIQPESLVKALLYAIERKRAQSFMDVQLAATKALLSPGSNYQVLEKALGAICEFMGWDFGMFLRTDEKSGLARTLSCWSNNINNRKIIEFVEAAREAVVPKGFKLGGEVWQAGLAKFVADISDGTSMPRCDLAESAGFVSSFAYPVSACEEPVGICLFMSRRSQEPDVEQKKLLELLGTQMAQAVLRKEQEESQAYLAATVRSSTDAIVGWGLDSVVSNWNEGAEAVFGYDGDEALGRNLESLFVPEERGSISLLLEQIHSGESFSGLEHKAMCKNGRVIVLSLTLFPVYSASGAIYGASFIARDITSEIALRQLDASIMREIVEKAPFGIARLDLDLNVLVYNDKLSEIFEPASTIEENAPLSSILDGVASEHIRACLLGGMPFLLPRYRLISSLGKSESVSVPADKFLEVSIWPVTAGGELAGAVLHVVDTSHTVWLERQREDYIASIAHDIKNPLVGAQMLLKMLLVREDLSADDRKKLIETIKESNDNLLSLVQNLIDIYRYDSLELALNCQRIDMAQLLLNSIGALSHLAEEKSVRFDFECIDGEMSQSQTDSTITADSIALRRVFANLLHNAVKFAPTGTAVSVELLCKPSRIIVKVSDQGPGVPIEERSKLFERFGQTKVGYSISGGTGLGLFLSNAIVKAHNGRIIYREGVDGGSTFVVSLPRDRIPQAPDHF